jgi:hypothetical protein
VGKKQNVRKLNIPSFEEDRKLEWQIPVRDLLIHVRDCQTECPQLNLALNNLGGVTFWYLYGSIVSPARLVCTGIERWL